MRADVWGQRRCPVCESGWLRFTASGIAAWCAVCERIHGPFELARALQQRIERKRAKLRDHKA